MNRESGALNKSDCPTMQGVTCKCPGFCRHCGWRRHMAIHCGVVGNPTKPYGHQFEEDLNRKPRRGNPNWADRVDVAAPKAG